MEKSIKFADCNLGYLYIDFMRNFFIIISSFLFITSCVSKNDNNVIYRDFSNNEWSRFDYLEGKIEVKNAPVKYDLVMEVLVSEIYPSSYENHRDNCVLEFNMTIKNPDNGGTRSKNYKYNLKDKEGNWKSDKQGEYYVFKLPIISEMTFGEEGTYDIKIENKYPRDPLEGIKSITLKYNNSK